MTNMYDDFLQCYAMYFVCYETMQSYSSHSQRGPLHSIKQAALFIFNAFPGKLNKEPILPSIKS